MMKNGLALAAISIAAVGCGVAFGYKMATDKELRTKIMLRFQDLFSVTKEQINVMSEGVAVKTARMTRNPKINQDWVENQWNSLGIVE